MSLAEFGHMYASDEVEMKCRVRITLPKAIRSALGIQVGDKLTVGLRDSMIVVETYTASMQRLQDFFCEGLDSQYSLVADLCSKRRREVTDGDSQ